MGCQNSFPTHFRAWTEGIEVIHLYKTYILHKRRLVVYPEIWGLLGLKENREEHPQFGAFQFSVCPICPTFVKPCESRRPCGALAALRHFQDQFWNLWRGPRSSSIKAQVDFTRTQTTLGGKPPKNKTSLKNPGSTRLRGNPRKVF